jgi:hypothetical protein
MLLKCGISLSEYASQVRGANVKVPWPDTKVQNFPLSCRPKREPILLENLSNWYLASFRLC